MRPVSLDSHGEPVTTREKTLARMRGEFTGVPKGAGDRHGTYAGWKRHQELEERPCAWCASWRRDHPG